VSDVLQPTSPRPPHGPADPARTLDTLATVLILVLTVGILYLAREILVPVAIAILLSFVLSPLVKTIRRIGLGKTASVGIVVVSAFVVTVAVGAILAKQISELAADAPRYQATVTQKVEGARTFVTNNPVLRHLNTAIADFAQMAPPEQKPEPAKPAASPPPSGTSAPLQNNPPKSDPVKVEVITPAPGVLTILQAAAGTAASPLATTAFVAIFIIFILMQREDLRDRFIRLAGGGDLQRTTLAMNDAAARLSRYFLAQVLLNTSFGLIVATGLALIGVPSAILWGIVALFMRFIPYVGSVGAVLFPLAMAAAAAPGWTMVIETAVLFAILEFTVGQIVEPLIYGHHTGISPIAVVLSATFWTWLWGPIGLVLSTPLTVCLVVLGRHVDRLSFLDVILGDAPALTPVESFYQRMLVGDPSEIVDHADGFLRDKSLLDYCDQIAMRALLMAQIDVRRGALEDARQMRIRDTMRDLVADLADRDEEAGIPGSRTPAPIAAPDADPETPGPSAEEMLPRVTIDPSWRREKAVICVAGRTALDEAAAHLLADLLADHGIGAHVEPAESLMSNSIAEHAEAAPRLVILSFLDADLKISQARFAVRRLRRHLPDAPIVAAFWMAEENRERTTGLCSDVRCDRCVSSLPEAIALCLERSARGDDIGRGDPSAPNGTQPLIDGLADADAA
jgi:predicted PurR-regulated permease PerM